MKKLTATDSQMMMGSQRSNPFYRWGESEMRTTLRIDDDLLRAVKEIAQRESKSTGAVVSDLLRQSLAHAEEDNGEARVESPGTEFGFRPFPKRGGIVTNEVINRLRAEGGD